MLQPKDLKLNGRLLCTSTHGQSKQVDACTVLDRQEAVLMGVGAWPLVASRFASAGVCRHGVTEIRCCWQEEWLCC